MPGLNSYVIELNSDFVGCLMVSSYMYCGNRALSVVWGEEMGPDRSSTNGTQTSRVDHFSKKGPPFVQCIDSRSSYQKGLRDPHTAADRCFEYTVFGKDPNCLA